jgi:hypothetical protein
MLSEGRSNQIFAARGERNDTNPPVFSELGPEDSAASNCHLSKSVGDFDLAHRGTVQLSLASVAF